MSGGAKKLLHAAAGTAAAGGATYVEDVFSTHLFTGTGSSNDIDNGIDLDDKGGLVWIKARNNQRSHALFDTERGANLLASNTTAAQYSSSGMTANSNGFTVVDNSVNKVNETIVSWTFARQEGFFDVVTWTGNATGSRAISHGLNAKVGTIIVKCTSHTQNWAVYHSGIPTGYGNLLNASTFATGSGNAVFGDSSYNNIDPTTSVFYVGTDNEVNGSGRTYVAYVFAEGTDSGSQIFGDDGDEPIIKCATFSTPNNLNDFSIDCGFEVQWVVFIRTNDGGGYLQYDNMRGFAHSYNSEFFLDNSNEEGTENQTRVVPTATGFANLGGKFEKNSTYAYIAIRRGPMKEPEAGTDVYIADMSHASAYENPMFQGTFPVDMSYFFDTSGSAAYLGTRLTGKSNAQINSNSSAPSETNHVWDYMSGWYNRGSGSDDNNIAHMFRRYPKVFDVVVYEGNGSPSVGVRNGLNHNLGVAPEMIIHKRLDSSSEWQVGAAPISKGGYFNLANSFTASFTPSNEFTATTFDVDGWISENHNNTSGGTYVALLFASLSGISKVGTYTGTGSNFNVTDLGAPVRYLLVKRTDSTGGATGGHWGFFDSTVQGITSGYDPFPYLSSSGTTLTTNQDVIDSHSSGFTVKDDTNSGFNINGGTYIYLAIA